MSHPPIQAQIHAFYDAATRYRSVRRLLSLPGHTRLHLCHDYPAASRLACWISTVAEQRAHNVHLHEGVGEADFIRLRQARDGHLAMPQQLLPSVQVNVRAGRLPAAEAHGVHDLKLPEDSRQRPVNHAL